MDHNTVRIGRGEDRDRGTLSLPDAMAIDLAVLDSHIATGVEIDCLIAALIDFAVGNLESDGIHSIHADGAAAVETAGNNGGVAAGFQT